MVCYCCCRCDESASSLVSPAGRSQGGLRLDDQVCSGYWGMLLLLKGSAVFMRHGTLIENTSKLEIKFKSL